MYLSPAVVDGAGYGREAATLCGRGWRAIRSSGYAGTLWAGRVVQSGAGTPPGRGSWCVACCRARSPSSGRLPRSRRPRAGDGWRWRRDGCNEPDSAIHARGRRRVAWLGIDDPVLLGEGTQKSSEVPLVAERQTLAVKPKLVVAKSASESGHELAAEDAAEHLDRQKEVSRWRDPVGVIRR